MLITHILNTNEQQDTCNMSGHTSVNLFFLFLSDFILAFYFQFSL